MTSKEKIGISKNFFCRDQYWQIISTLYGDQVFKNAPGATLRKCKFGENCRGAHSEDEIHTLPHNYNFTKLDKSKLDLVDIYNNICDVFETSLNIIQTGGNTTDTLYLSSTRYVHNLLIIQICGNQNISAYSSH